jgi:hypothetical protein
VDLASEPLYASGTFWAIAGVAAVLLSTVAIMWITMRAATPKRRLLYSMPVVESLLNEQSDMPQDIEVSRAGKSLSSPKIVTVELASRSRFDITREAFDGGKPLCLNLHTPIVECLKVSVSPSDRSVPSTKIDGSNLLIEPVLIGRSETITFTLLVDGPWPHLEAPEQSLIDIDIIPAERLQPNRYQRFATIPLSIIVIVAGAATIKFHNEPLYALAAAGALGIVTWINVGADLRKYGRPPRSTGQ